MTSILHLQAVQRSDAGLVREVNEDAFARFEPTEEHLLRRGCLYVVADGLGGHRAGDIASRLAAETILDVYFNSEGWREPAQGLEIAIWQANQEIFRLAQQNPELSSMGTTVVAAVIQGDQLITANVGDSREYLFRSQLLEQLTIDHAAMGITCDLCHGPTIEHMHDEMLMTAPDRLFGRREIRDFCSSDACHAPDDGRQYYTFEDHTDPAKPLAFAKQWHGRMRPNGRAITDDAVCTDCHGTHRTPAAKP